MTETPTPPEGGATHPEQPHSEAEVTPSVVEEGTATQPMAPVAAEQLFGPPPGGVPGATYAAPAGPPRRGVRGMWREATSTTGGRVATIIAAALGAIALIAVIGLGAAAIGHLGDDRRPAGVASANRGQGGPGMRGFGDDATPFGQRGQNGNGTTPFGQRGQGGQNGDGRGPGGLGGGLADGLGGLGGILHGEFVTQGTGSEPTTMEFQVGEVTAYTKGSSLAVKSSDGFATTYRVDGNSRLVASSATAISVGDTVRVIARKDGPTVTMVQVIAGGGGTSSSTGA